MRRGHLMEILITPITLSSPQKIIKNRHKSRLIDPWNGNQEYKSKHFIYINWFLFIKNAERVSKENLLNNADQKEIDM